MKQKKQTILASTALALSLLSLPQAQALPATWQLAPYQASDQRDQQDWVKVQEGQTSLEVAPYPGGPGSKLSIRGRGWTKADGSPSTVSIKLEYLDAEGKIRQYQRPDGAISDYLTSIGKTADPTSWALLLPPGSPSSPDQGLLALEADGSFELEIPVPADLEQAPTGSYLAIRAQSGRNATGDTQRTLRTDPIPVRGQAAQMPSEDQEVACISDQAKPSMSIQNPQLTLGEKLHLVGEGWCNTSNQRATTIGIKIDDGAISRTDSSLHSNQTIWAIIHPDPATGRVDTYLDLPDGSEKSSRPAFGQGAHSLRILSGSLGEGDRSSSMKLDFQVGAYRPQGLPDTLEGSELTPDKAQGFQAKLEGLEVSMQLAGLEKGQWIALTPYLDGSARARWGSGWVQTDELGRISYRLPEPLAAGSYQLVVQSGQRENYGQLLGWASLSIEQEETAVDNQSSVFLPPAEETGQAPLTEAAPAPASVLAPLHESRMVGGLIQATGGQQALPPSGLSQVITQRQADRVLVAPAPAPAKSQEKVRPQAKQAAEKASASSAPSSSPSQTAQARAEDESPSLVSRESSEANPLADANNLLLLAASGLLLALLYYTRRPTKPTTPGDQG